MTDLPHSNMTFWRSSLGLMLSFPRSPHVIAFFATFALKEVVQRPKVDDFRRCCFGYFRRFDLLPSQSVRYGSWRVLTVAVTVGFDLRCFYWHRYWIFVDIHNGCLLTSNGGIFAYCLFLTGLCAPPFVYFVLFFFPSLFVKCLVCFFSFRMTSRIVFSFALTHETP